LDGDEDQLPRLRVLREYEKRRKMADTHEADEIEARIAVLEGLLQAYRSGLLNES
jgi:hypothetical protein